MVLCGTCEERVLRSQINDHPHPVTEPTVEQETGMPEDCQFDTQTFRVEFITEHVEVVTVEATDKWDAKDLAEHERTYNGEFMDTLHTTMEAFGEPSQASDEYLRTCGLLPDEEETDE
jgi:hypothetical protein